MDKRIREGIEACRPDSDDLKSPDMADAAQRIDVDPQMRLTFERVQQWDVAISQSIDDVGVPPGLAERILDRLRAAREEWPASSSADLLAHSVGAAVGQNGATGEVHVSPAPHPHAVPRRHWAGVVSLALLACVLVVIAGYWLQQPKDLEIDVLAEQWRSELGTKWEDVANAPRDFAVPDAILAHPARWQKIGKFTTVVAYELVDAKARRAMLYVANITRPGSSTAPPPEPDWTSGGKAIAYWQSGSRLYVLVVDDERSYRAFVRPSTTPLA